MRNRPILQMVVIGVIACAIGIPVALAIPWFPSDASKQAHNIHTLYDVLLIASVPVFVLVETVVLFSVWKFRMRPGQEEMDGPPIHGNTRLEVVWTAVPAMLIVALCTYAYTVLRSNEDSKSNEMTVNVTARQFAFEFSYPTGPGKQVVSPVLYLPEGRPVVFKLRALDVIHSFFVPNFSEKLDAVPGITTTVRVTPTRLGSYPVECTELCGAGHSLMRAAVRVVTPAVFEKWLSSQKPNGPPPVGTPPPNAVQPGVPGAASCGREQLELEQLLELGLADERRGWEGRVHRVGRLRQLPHARSRRHDRDRGTESGHRDRARRQEGRDAGQALHHGLDPQAQLVHRHRLRPECHAADIWPDLDADSGPSASQLHLERDKVRTGMTQHRNLVETF